MHYIILYFILPVYHLNIYCIVLHCIASYYILYYSIIYYMNSTGAWNKQQTIVISTKVLAYHIYYVIYLVVRCCHHCHKCRSVVSRSSGNKSVHSWYCIILWAMCRSIWMGNAVFVYTVHNSTQQYTTVHRAIRAMYTFPAIALSTQTL